MARNEKFQALLQDIGRVCHQFVLSGKHSETNANPGKVANLPIELVADLSVDGSRKVSQAIDATLAAIGEVGWRRQRSGKLDSISSLQRAHTPEPHHLLHV